MQQFRPQIEHHSLTMHTVIKQILSEKRQYVVWQLLYMSGRLLNQWLTPSSSSPPYFLSAVVEPAMTPIAC